MRVALVHDYLREYGGAERVLEVLHEMFPDAPLYTAYYNPKALGPHAKNFSSWDIRTSWFQNFPFANRLLSPFRIFAPLMFESFDMSEYDLVISSSSAVYFAKAVITKPETLHISYIHTPPRFLYGYTTSFNYKKHWWTRIGGEIVNHFLRIWDFEVSQRPDILVVNSKNVQARIKKFYRRDSVVVYPPVDIPVIASEVKQSTKMEKITASSFDPSASLRAGKLRTPRNDKDGYFLSLCRLARSKGVDVIIEACAKLGLPLKVVGTGPELAPLRQGFAGYKNIEFLGQVSDEELARLYAGAKATIVASEDEDFGIVPVESMACGTPVIAVKAGGFLETVVEGKTGQFFKTSAAAELMKVLENFDPNKFKPEDLRKQAEKFSKERFKKEFLGLVKNGLDKSP